MPQRRDELTQDVMKINRRNLIRGIGTVAVSSIVEPLSGAQQADASAPATYPHTISNESITNEFLERSFVSGREYFVLRSGSIQLIVQRDTFDLAPAILWLAFDARQSVQSGKKRNALNFEGGAGFLRSALGIRLGGFEFTALGHETEAEWLILDGVPTVEARWWAGGILVREQIRAFRGGGVFQRRIVLESKNMGAAEQVEIMQRLPTAFGTVEQAYLVANAAKSRIRLKAEHAASRVDAQTGLLHVGPLTIAPDEIVSVDTYLLVETLPISASATSATSLSNQLSRTQTEWKKLSTIQTSDEVMRNVFTNASFALDGMVSDDGTMDAGIFEYGGQWVRDTSNTALGLLHAGHFELARAALAHIFNKMIAADGSTMIYGGFDEVDREELDQMGELLLAIRAYVDWTDDRGFVIEYRKKIIATANRPLEARFRHSSGLVHGTREFWERTTSDGLETIYQVYLVLGLECAISLAPLLEADSTQIAKWQNAAKSLRNTALHDPKFSIISNGRLIKRRAINGDSTREIRTEMALPDVPVNTERIHLAEPDAVTALPIALGFIDPQSDVAKHTLDFLETLWNARWFGGGYERYHSSSQPDQPGPWPFANCFLMRAQHEAKLYERSRRTLEWMYDVQGGRTGGWFEEIPIVRSQAAKAGILPWTSAEVALFAVRHVIGFRFESGQITVRPNLYPDSPPITADIRFRASRISITIPKGKYDHAIVNGQRAELDSKGTLSLPSDFDGGHIHFE